MKRAVEHRGAMQCRRAAFVALIEIALAIGMTASAAADEERDVVARTPNTTYTRAQSEGWEASTRGRVDDDATGGEPDSILTVRAYDGFERFDARRNSDPALAVDVSAEIETCPDGSRRIRAMEIGGTRFAVDGGCRDHGIRAGDHPLRDDTAGEAATRNGPDALLQCDAATWRCRVVD